MPLWAIILICVAVLVILTLVAAYTKDGPDEAVKSVT